MAASLSNHVNDKVFYEGIDTVLTKIVIVLIVQNEWIKDVYLISTIFFRMKTAECKISITEKFRNILSKTFFQI